MEKISVENVYFHEIKYEMFVFVEKKNTKTYNSVQNKIRLKSICTLYVFITFFL